MKRSHLTIRAGLAFFLMLLALPASAAAGTKSESAALTAPNVVSSVTAKCPGGQRATGGGYRSTEPPNTSSGRFFVTESRKIGQRSWRVSGFRNFDPGSPVLTTFVFCDGDAPKTKQRSASLFLAAGFGFVDAACGSAGKAQAGGFSSTADLASATNIFLSETFRIAKGAWRTRASTEAGGIPTLTAYVYCAKSKAPKARTGSVTTSGSGVKEFALSPSCKRGTRMFAGGFSQNGLGNATWPWELSAAGRAFRVGAFRFGSGSSPLNAIAYCG